ncbi:hypothetical protein K3G63_06595 [Hymenobacter sp. HSC-4F20]|uniref:hypothetical protein n=1 Tax=Hymenobacter sp. HSC-4F20 TaxID=2864135 RepID=UPI001C73A50F|nr:hypothetical protein [Hymenobacter sp. HSC-4F20]MBX0290099.1 hypothetical protein [Hymenobacter sp. HSC-4F20]
MKSILTKFFPDHDASTAGFISALLLVAVLTTCITIHDALAQRADLYEVGFIGLCVLLAAATFYLGRKDKRVGK